MSTTNFKGQPVRISGTVPAVGTQAPDFKLAGADLSDVSLEKFGQSKKILNIVPSLDTSVCAESAKKFNQAMTGRKDVVLLNISMDLPFAQKRFCDSEKLTNIVTLSAFRSPSFGKDYGVRIEEGPLAGLLARVVLVLDGENRVLHSQLVPEISHEPDYDAALRALRG